MRTLRPTRLQAVLIACAALPVAYRAQRWLTHYADQRYMQYLTSKCRTVRFDS